MNVLTLSSTRPIANDENNGWQISSKKKNKPNENPISSTSRAALRSLTNTNPTTSPVHTPNLDHPVSINKRLTDHLNRFNLAGIFAECSSSMDLFNNVNVSAALYGIAHLLGQKGMKYENCKEREQRVINALCEKAFGYIANYEGIKLNTLAWVLKKIEINMPKLSSAIAVELLNSSSGKLDRLNGPELTNLAYLTSESIFNPSELMQDLFVSIIKSLTANSSAKLNECNEKNLSTLAWALAVVDIGESCKDFVLHLADVVQQRSFGYTDEGYMQLKQFHTLFTKGRGYPIDWNPTFLNQVNQAALNHAKSQIHISDLQQDVTRTLGRLSKTFRCEYVDPETCASMDIAFMRLKTDIEVDGDSHFISGTQEYKRQSLLKDKILSACGWKVIRVSYLVWKNLYTDLAKENYLKNLLPTNYF